MAFVSVGAVIFAAIQYFKKKESSRDKSHMVFNFQSYSSGKKFYGTLKSMEEGAGGRMKVVYYPMDINTRNLSKEELIKKAKPVEVIIESNKISSVTRGPLSNDASLIFIHPDNAEDIPDDIRKTRIGSALMWAAIESNREQAIIKQLHEGTLKMEEALEYVNTGEIGREIIEQMQELSNARIKMAVLNAEKEKKSGVAPLTTPPGGFPPYGQPR